MRIPDSPFKEKGRSERKEPPTRKIYELGGKGCYRVS
jgi:hypothetical protein